MRGLLLFDTFIQHAHFEHQREEKHHNERKVADQAELIVAVVLLERFGDG